VVRRGLPVVGRESYMDDRLGPRTPPQAHAVLAPGAEGTAAGLSAWIRRWAPQRLLNLVSNAIKYTDEGSIALRAEADDGRLWVAVSDTGVGIPSDELDRIFDEFHRADSASALQRHGTGLGLTISRRLAGELGGDIAVDSRLGVGSTFMLDLPLNHGNGGA
jgi:signal transduction histidine kinase